jgi:hypothetical protein
MRTTSTREGEFRKELEHTLNRHSMENGSNTPDFMLADFLHNCLRIFDDEVNARSDWYGRRDAPGQVTGGPAPGPRNVEKPFRATSDECVERAADVAWDRVPPSEALDFEPKEIDPIRLISGSLLRIADALDVNGDREPEDAKNWMLRRNSDLALKQMAEALAAAKAEIAKLKEDRRLEARRLEVEAFEAETNRMRALQR